MIGGDCGDLVLDDSVHLTDSKVDSASEHVLVVDGKPLSQYLDNFRLQNFVDGQFTELFHFQNWKRLGGFWLISKSLAVGRLGHLLAKVFFDIAALCSVVQGQLVTDTWLTFVFKTFRAFHAKHRLNYAEALKELGWHELTFLCSSEIVETHLSNFATNSGLTISEII